MNKYNETSESVRVVQGQELIEGIWVDYNYNRETYTGYTTDKQGYNWIEVEIVSPVKQLICVPKDFLSILPVQNCSWDTPYILELARSMNDKDWENEIIEEISMWRSVDDLKE